MFVPFLELLVWLLVVGLTQEPFGDLFKGPKVYRWCFILFLLSILCRIVMFSLFDGPCYIDLFSVFFCKCEETVFGRIGD